MERIDVLVHGFYEICIDSGSDVIRYYGSFKRVFVISGAGTEYKALYVAEGSSPPNVAEHPATDAAPAVTRPPPSTSLYMLAR